MKLALCAFEGNKFSPYCILITGERMNNGKERAWLLLAGHSLGFGHAEIQCAVTKSVQSRVTLKSNEGKKPQNNKYTAWQCKMTQAPQQAWRLALACALDFLMTD